MTAVDADLDDIRSLTTKQVSELTGINRKTLDTWRSQGTGPTWFKPVGVVLYPLPELRAWIAAQRAATETTERRGSAGETPAARFPISA